MAVALETVVKQLEDSGIVAPGKLENFVPPKGHPKDVESLIAELVKEKHLTKFQAVQVAAGKAKSLILGGYTIIDKIGAGGMGQVFKAEHRRMKRVVAIKTLPAGTMKDPAVVARFQREVEAAAKLRHTNIVAADDADEANGVHFLVMEYVEGKDLSATVKKDGPFPVAKAVNYVLQAARGLEFAHSEGVVHRDIKPANLLLDKKGVVKILDMGLARIESHGNVAAQAELTGTGTIMGTVDYMAPEQGTSTKHADARADIYSLGCTLHYLIAGKATFAGETIAAKLVAHHTHPIPDLIAVNADVSDQLDAVFKRMIAKRVEDRYQTMTEVIADLEQCRGEGSGVRGQGSGIGTSGSGIGSVGSPSGSHSVPSGLMPTIVTDAPVIATNKPAPMKKTAAAAVHDPSAKPQATSAGGKSNKPPMKLIAAGVGGFALLVSLGIWLIVRDKDGNEVARVAVPEGGSATVVTNVPQPPNTPVAGAPGSQPTSSQSAVSFFGGPDPSPPPGDYALRFVSNANSRPQVVVPSLKLTQAEPWCIEGFVTLQNHDGIRYANPFGFGEFSVQIQDAARGWLAIRWSSASNVSNIQAISKQPWEKDRRLHIAAVYEGKELRIYLDGRRAGASEMTGTPKEPGTPFSIATDLNGILDEVRVSKSARYQADFQPAARLEPDADTLALYHFDEGFGTVLKDASGNRHDGQIWGGTWVKPDGSAIPTTTPAAAPSFLAPTASSGDFALEFDGKSAYGLIPWKYKGLAPVTIEAWALAETSPPSIQSPVFLVADVDGGGISLRSDGAGVGTKVSQPFVKAASPAPQRWAHYALCYEPGKELRYYRDGKFEGKAAAPDPYLPNKAPFVLGAQPDANAFSGFFLGKINRVRISQSARYAKDFPPPTTFTPDKDTVALYLFNEGTGNVLNDSSGNNYHGKITGATWVRGTTPPAPQPTAAPPIAVAPFDAAQAHSHQAAWAKHLGTQIETVNSVGAKMILLPPGEFLMGSTDEQVEAALKVADEIKADQGTKDRIQKNERPQHKVVITKPFLLSATEVTVGQFKKFAAAMSYQTEAEKATQDAKTGTYLAAASDDAPAAYITWNDATAYCQWLSTQEKTTYRLPTEAEWEYACRAGTTTQYSFGDDVALLDQYGWSKENAGGKSHPVGTKLPNGFGLFDMHGNLYEWCGDFYDEKRYSTSTLNDPAAGSNRVIRGGHWNSNASACRSASRNNNTPSNRFNAYGFRCVSELAVPTVTATSSITPPTPPQIEPASKPKTIGSPPQPAAAAAQVDLLPLVDLNQDVLSGQWTRQGTEIHSAATQGENHKLRLPVDPGEEYSLQLACAADRGYPKVTLPFGSKGLVVHLSGGRVILQLASSKVDAADNPRSDQLRLHFGENKVRDVRIDVTRPATDQVRIVVIVGDEPVLDWTGTREQIQASPGPDLPEPTLLFETYQTKAAATKLLEAKLTTTRGPMKFLRGAAAAAGISAIPQSAVPAPQSWNTPAFQQWLTETQALPAEQQIDAVVKKLIELNPGFDGKVVGVDGKGTPKIENGMVTFIQFATDEVTDISPVRAFKGLSTLHCKSSGYTTVGKLADLSPLQGMRLRVLDISRTRVSDLSPLQGNPLTELRCDGTLVADLSPLKGMSTLIALHIATTPVSDLSPLRGLQLTSLGSSANQVADLSPLEDMQLVIVHVANTPVTDLSPLKGMPLRILNFGATKVTDLSPLQGMRVQDLSFFNTSVSDLSPLKGMPLLKTLAMAQTAVTDLSPLKECKDLTTVNAKIVAINAAEVDALKAALPNCKITWDGAP